MTGGHQITEYRQNHFIYCILIHTRRAHEKHQTHQKHMYMYVVQVCRRERGLRCLGIQHENVHGSHIDSHSLESSVWCGVRACVWVIFSFLLNKNNSLSIHCHKSELLALGGYEYLPVVNASR